MVKLGMTVVLVVGAAAAQAGYQVGDTIDPGTEVVDARLERQPLLGLFDPAAEVVVLILFGGGAVDPDPAGELWCEDSQAELQGLRALVQKFSAAPVQFLGVAFPAVYSSDRHGYEANVFLSPSDDDSTYQDARQKLLNSTEALLEAGKLPYEQVYYDFRLWILSNPEYEQTGLRADQLPTWAGRFKSDQDHQKYGLPTVWLLDSSGVVLAEAFTGNIYGDNPPVIRYTMEDLERAIRAQLEAR